MKSVDHFCIVILYTDRMTLRGGSKGHREHVYETQSRKRIILHRHVLFYKFTDIAVMFVSRDLRPGCHWRSFRWLWSPPSAFRILRQKWLETERRVDEMIINNYDIVIQCQSVLTCLFFLSVSVLAQWRNILWALCRWTPLETSVPQTRSLPVLLPNKNPESAPDDTDRQTDVMA